jgi:hypothetical protein
MLVKTRQIVCEPWGYDISRHWSDLGAYSISSIHIRLNWELFDGDSLWPDKILCMDTTEIIQAIAEEVTRLEQVRALLSGPYCHNQSSACASAPSLLPRRNLGAGR